MSTKKKAPSTIIKEQAAEIEKLTKELESATKSKDMYYGYYQDSKKEIDELHTMLDAFPNVPRKTTPEDGSGRYASDLSLHSRITIMLAKNDRT